MASSDYFDLPPIQTDEAEFGTKDYEIVQWCESRLDRGEEFLKAQIGYDLIDRTIKEIFSYEMQGGNVSYIPTASKMSQTRANLVAKIAEDLTAMLTDVRYFWKYSTKNPRYEAQARISNMGGEQWYTNRLIDLRIGDVIRYYTIAGTGIAHLYYSNQIQDFILEAEDPRNVFPVDPISYHTFQDCNGVIMRRPRTPDWIKQEFDKVVKPDNGGAKTFFSWLTRKVIEGPGERGGPLSKNRTAQQVIPGTPTTWVNTMYLRDRRTNPKGSIVRMGPWSGEGRPKAPWSYEVKPGMPLFPFGRLIIWGGGALLSDGPSPYWHGKYPVIKFTLNPWPMSWFGKAPLWDCLPLQASMTGNLRVIDDHAAQVAQPGVVADRNVARSELNKLDTRAAGFKIKTNLASGKGIQIHNPPPLDDLIWEVVKWCEEKMKMLAGTVDISNMASLAQIPSDDTIDSIMKAMTPGVRMRSRILEGAYKELAEQFLFNFWEWDTTEKRLEKFGPQAATNEDYDFIKGTGIPDDVPDGGPGDIGASAAAMTSDSPRPIHERAKAMLLAISCQFDASSLLNSSAMQEIAKFFLLSKMGYCSVFTLMEKLGIMNYAPPGMVIPVDEISRLQLQQQLGIGMLANAQGRKATDSAAPSIGSSGNGPTIQTS
jgi:hypothetical protein